MSFENFITLTFSILMCGILVGLVIKRLWEKLKRSRIYYLLTPKLLKPYAGDK